MVELERVHTFATHFKKVKVLRKISGRVRGKKSSENDRKIWVEFIKARTFAIRFETRATGFERAVGEKAKDL